MELQNKALLATKCLIGGQWLAAADGRAITVTNPANGQTLAAVPSLSRAETAQAVAAAQAAWPAWRETPAVKRGEIMRRWQQLIMANLEDLARILTSEQGKPLAEARAEITVGGGYVVWYAEEGRRAYGEVIPSPLGDRRLLTIRQPVGVAASITPWNFPSSMILRKVAPALAAGCTVVAKPASLTPLSALALGVLAQEAGFPDGVFNLVSGRPDEVGAELAANHGVRKLSFTGSTAVGKALMAQCAATVKKVSLELGGNAPFIVFDDADLEAAVNGALGCKYRNSGQTCICTNRFLVQDGIHDAFVERLVAKVRELKVGSGLEEGVTQGPLIDQASLDKVGSLVAEALAGGARPLIGGGPHPLGGLFFQPTILTGVRPEMAVCREEIFGPVAPVLRFRDEAEAVALANDTAYGLASYVYTRDIGRFFRVAEALEYGMVGVNEVLLAMPETPFGGVKESGLGREGGRQGLDEFLVTKYILAGGLGK